MVNETQQNNEKAKKMFTSKVKLHYHLQHYREKLYMLYVNQERARENMQKEQLSDGILGDREADTSRSDATENYVTNTLYYLE